MRKQMMSAEFTPEEYVEYIYRTYRTNIDVRPIDARALAEHAFGTVKQKDEETRAALFEAATAFIKKH
jgi:hypothetical protein